MTHLRSAEEPDIEVVRFYVEEGARLDIHDSLNLSVIHLAVMNPNISFAILEYLVT